jgi:hypothetical protein
MAEPIISDLAHRTRFSDLNKLNILFSTNHYACGSINLLIRNPQAPGGRIIKKCSYSLTGTRRRIPWQNKTL